MTHADYAWSLESGLFTVGPQETVAVLITDIAESAAGGAVIVRFFNSRSTLLHEVQGEVLPGEPLIVELDNDPTSQGRTPMRLEIVLVSSDAGFSPVTTVELWEADDLTLGWKCAGPLEGRVGPVTYCPDFVAVDLSA